MSKKKVIVMRGPSGSGKSTYVKRNYPDAYVCSADQFFYDQEGNYNFDPKKIGQAHATCKKNFQKALKSGKNLVVVDNTNTKIWEFKPYVKAAEEAGYDVEFVRVETPVDVAVKRNVHGVPEDAVKRMAGRMQDLPSDWSRKEKVVSGVE